MTVTESSSNLEPTVDLRDRPAAVAAGGLAVVDTTELRWFIQGPMPTNVSVWFTNAGTVGVVDERCDTYRLDGRRDQGVKRRHRQTPELKIRQSIGDQLDLAPGLAGRLEQWRKWSPAAGLAEAEVTGTWLDVTKTVVKRRFTAGGVEVEFPSDGATPSDESGCDVEIAAVTVGDIEAWSFAFAAFGPVDQRRDAIVATWLTLAADGSYPSELVSRSGQADGYPEWLARIASPSVTAPTLEHH